MATKYRLTTLGCKVNQYETQVVRETLESAGIHAAAEHEVADWAVINTCAVTGSALRKSRQAVRRAAREGARRVVVIGCGATAEAGRFRGIAGVTSVFTHADDVRAELARLLAESSESGTGNGPRPLSEGPSSQNNTVDAQEHTMGDRSLTVADRLQKHSLTVVARQDRSAALAAGHQSAERYDESMRPAVSMLSVAATRDGDHHHARWSISRALPIVKRGDHLDVRIERFAGHQRAFLKVQDGCDAFCTYCIIPRLRPRLSWKTIEDAVAEARRLVASGHKEIILTGIFLGAYGRDTALRHRLAEPRPSGIGGPGGHPGSGVGKKARRVAGHSPLRTERNQGTEEGVLSTQHSALSTPPGAVSAAPLADLVDAVARVPGLERLRLSSLEPGDVDAALLEALAGHATCVPHLHLPLQSGSPDILRRMNRQYSADDFLGMIDRVRAALDRPAISTDIIVGFPGETEAEFRATLEVARYAGFCKIHAFPFSPRQGTAAARWTKDFVPPAVVRERMERLTELEAELSLDFRRRFVGQVERVIVEDDGEAENGPPVSLTEDDEAGGLSVSARSGARPSPLPLSLVGRGVMPGATGGLSASARDECDGNPRSAWHDVRHGRADRYFRVHFTDVELKPGDVAWVRIDRVSPGRTHGTRIRGGSREVALPLLAWK